MEKRKTILIKKGQELPPKEKLDKPVSFEEFEALFKKSDDDKGSEK